MHIGLKAERNREVGRSTGASSWEAARQQGSKAGELSSSRATKLHPPPPQLANTYWNTHKKWECTYWNTLQVSMHKLKHTWKATKHTLKHTHTHRKTFQYEKNSQAQTQTAISFKTYKICNKQGPSMIASTKQHHCTTIHQWEEVNCAWA